MDKAKFLATVRSLYRAANRADVSSDEKTPAELWMHPDLAGRAGCQHLDAMLHDMVALGMISGGELQALHDTM